MIKKNTKEKKRFIIPYGDITYGPYTKKCIIFDKPIDFDDGCVTYNYNMRDIFIDIIIDNIAIKSDNEMDMRLGNLLKYKFYENSLNIISGFYLRDKININKNIKTKIGLHRHPIEKKICNILQKLNICEYKSNKKNCKFIKKIKGMNRIEKNIRYDDIISIKDLYGFDNLFYEENNYTNDDISEKKYGYLYLIKYFNLNDNRYEYKFGKTNRNPYERLKEHGHHNQIIFIEKVKDTGLENHIKNIIKNDENIEIVKGEEYYYCDDEDYIRYLIITEILQKMYDKIIII